MRKAADKLIKNMNTKTIGCLIFYGGFLILAGLAAGARLRMAGGRDSWR